MGEAFSIQVVLAALSMGIVAVCIVLLLCEVLELIHVDKDVAMREEIKQLPIILRIFMPLTPTLLPLSRMPMFATTRTQMKDKILMAGYDQVINEDEMMALRLVLALSALFMFIGASFLGKPIYGLLLGGCLLVYPAVWLNSTVKRRHFQIVKALPNVLDLLTLSVEAGKDFLTSLRDILARRKMDALGEELGRTLHEIQLGKQRPQALKDLAQRVRQPDLSAVVNAIVQAETLGVSIGQLLRIQGDQLRNKRFVRAEKLANETPVKIIFPVVIFIFPAVFIILMGPIIGQVLNMFMK